MRTSQVVFYILAILLMPITAIALFIYFIVNYPKACKDYDMQNVINFHKGE